MYMPVYRKVEDKLPLMPKNQNLKKNAFAFEHLWLNESTLPSRIASHNFSETAQLSKILFDNSPLTVQQFGHNIVSPKFPATLFFLNLLESISPA